MRDCQDQLTPLMPNPDGPEKNEALRGPEEGQLESTRYKRRQTTLGHYLSAPQSQILKDEIKASTLTHHWQVIPMSRLH